MAARGRVGPRVQIWSARLSLAIAVVGFLVAVPSLTADGWPRFALSMAHHAWILAWLLAFSFLARALTVTGVLGAFLTGFFTSMWMAYNLGTLTGEWLGPNDFLQLAVAVPIIEEVAKLIPVVIAVLAWRWQRAGSVAAIDLAVLGVAAGAGFAVHEDSMWPRLSGSGWQGPLGWVLPSSFQGEDVAVGHAGWTGLVALAIGIWFVNRRRRWTRLLPVLALALAVADHGMWNSLGGRYAWRGFLLDGYLVAGVFVIGVLITVAIETRVVHRLTQGVATKVAVRLPRVLSRSRSVRNLIGRWRLIVRLLREMASRSHQVAVIERGAPLPPVAGATAAPTAEVTS